MSYYSHANYIEEIKEEQKFCSSLKAKLLQSLENCPEGKLRVSSCRKRTIYLHIIPNMSKMKYIKKNQLELVSQLAQKEYDQQLVEILEAKIHCNAAYLAGIEKIRSMENVYEDLSKKRQMLVQPRILNDQQYAERWLSVPYKRKTFADGTPEFFCEKGDRVRSKSEIIIADMLYKRGIPYRYECPIILDNGYTVYPDFTVLRMKDRKECIWEHFGMMDDPEYCTNALKKIEKYQKNGYILGENFFVTFETRSSQLETASVQRIIQRLS